MDIDFKTQTIKMPKFKTVRVVLHRNFKGDIKTCTVSKTTTNKYFISVLVDDGKEPPKRKVVKESTSVGLDVGLKSFLVDSDNNTVSNPQFYRNAEPRLKILGRRLSRKVKGGNNRRKAQFRLACKHEKIANQRVNFLHQTSVRLVKNHDTVFVEDLNVKGMLKNHCLAKSISDVSWSEFFRQLKYKSDWQGTNVIEIGRFEPSSKMCWCGTINKDLTLADREWTCKACGSVNDRDYLAASNIKKFGLLGLNYHTRTDCPGGPVESSALAGALKQENICVSI